MNDRLERTQIYDWHKEHGDVIPFAGWEMPVRYSSIKEEHMAVRDSCGIFDVSHFIFASLTIVRIDPLRSAIECSNHNFSDISPEENPQLLNS